jgi:RNA polymerase sigma factor (sigma-70 family)
LAASQLRTVIHHLRKNVLADSAAALTDGQLLEAFINRKDEAAFEALVRRHGPMVLGVCRRILRDHHDADDAFQATFLVLVRKAASVKPREMVGNFLYGVARTTAQRARIGAARRAVRERQVAVLPEREAAEPDDLWQELQPLLDQELGRLPEKYRVPILLCDLGGKSIKQAAHQLRWPQGTLAGRLARARALLAKRLSRYGVLTSGAALAPALAQKALASLPPSLVAATPRAASRWAGNMAATGLISPQVAGLTEGVLRMMVVNKFKTIAMVLMIAALVGGAGLFYRTQAAEPATNAPPATALLEDAPANDATEEAPQPSNQSLLPTGLMPRQALVSLDKRGRLLVRTLDIVYEPTAVSFRGKTYTSYQTTEMLRSEHYEMDMVKVFDARGKSILKKILPDLLKKETVALVSTEPKAADPLNLRLFKEATLLFVLPSRLPPTPPPAPVAPGMPYYQAPTYGGPVSALVEPPAPATAPGSPAVIPPPVATPQPSINSAETDQEATRGDMETIGTPWGGQQILVTTPNLKIPLAIEPEQRAAAKELRLFVSANKGETWKCVATTPPEGGSIVFRTPKDGLYYFAVQPVGQDGKAPPSESLHAQVTVEVRTSQRP